MQTTSSFTETQLLECSRRSSIQKMSGNTENNAIFTNKLGSGVELKVGDEVSIHSAIVSERGAGNETIELKGNVIGSVKRTITNVSSYTERNNYKDNGYINVLNREDAVDIENKEVTLDVKDNEVNMSIEYYKATNGENCFSLPRRFVSPRVVLQWTELDSASQGAPYRAQRNGTIIETDYYRDRNKVSVWGNTWETNYELLKIRQDGTKHTIFTREGPTFYGVNSSIPTGIPELPYLDATIDNVKNGNGSVDPAVDIYGIYKELKTVEIPTGRRSADFIAETFTNSLQNASSLENYDFWRNVDNPSTDTVNANQGQLAGVYQTDTFKPFNCGNGSTMNASNFDKAMLYDFSGVGTNGSLSQDILDWVNCFQNVAFKRPEFVTAGRENLGSRELNPYIEGPNHWITRVSEDSDTGHTKMEISINMEYNASNCLRVHNFFKTQKLYPEMWDFRNASNPYYKKGLTSENSRFLHLDMVQAYDGASKKVSRGELGSDAYYGSIYRGETNASHLLNMIKYDTYSQPLFVTFLKDDEDSFYTNPNNNRLSYGTMKSNASDNITFITESIGGVPKSYYNGSGFFIGGLEKVGNASYELPKYKRFIGYDLHFSAYGNSAIGLWTPSATPDFAENTQVALLPLNSKDVLINGSVIRAEVINKTYIGSSNPKLVYDNIKDRFGWSDFYTPEYQGNYGGAGDVVNGSGVPSNPIVDGSALVYKINKRLRKQSCCPGMGPYLDFQDITIKTTRGGGTGLNKVSFDLPSKNIFPFSIMDCHSGICISDFGIDEDQWEDSLMGILGFSYEQLQSEISQKNTMQNRVNTFNKNKLNKVTTQGIIKAEDTLIYNQNIFGGIMYKPNIFTSVVITDQPNQVPGDTFQYTVPVNILTSSMIITADNVPKQMLNPFFSIRSDLIDDTSAYLGSRDSGQTLPTMGTVLKNYNSGDYFYGQDEGITFTVTKPKIITSITTSINEPDGSFCRLDDSSAVIYKINKKQMYPINLVQQLFGKK